MTESIWTAARTDFEERYVFGATHLHAQTRRGRAYQCIQFSLLGDAGKARAHFAGRRAGNRQTCVQHRLPN